MPKPAKGSRLGSGPAHEKLLLAGLAAALFREERITTTQAKARRLRPVAEKLITTAKEGTVASRRRALAVVEDPDVIHKLYSDIAPRFAERNGGYTRIIKLGPRKGDAAPLVLIELVEGAAPETKPAEEERRRGLLRRRSREAESGAAGGRRASGSQEASKPPSRLSGRAKAAPAALGSSEPDPLVDEAVGADEAEESAEPQGFDAGDDTGSVEPEAGE